MVMEVSSAEYSASSALPMNVECGCHYIDGLLRVFASMGHSERQVTKIHLSFCSYCPSQQVCNTYNTHMVKGTG